MAKGQYLSNHQQKIVKRYYEHADTIALTKLAESASELFLCTDKKKSDRLWKTGEGAVAKVAAADPDVKKILETRDIKGLAQLVSDLSRK